MSSREFNQWTNATNNVFSNSYVLRNFFFVIQKIFRHIKWEVLRLSFVTIIFNITFFEIFEPFFFFFSFYFSFLIVVISFAWLCLKWNDKITFKVSWIKSSHDVSQSYPKMMIYLNNTIKLIHEIFVSSISYYIEYKLNLRNFLICSINFVSNETTFENTSFVFITLWQKKIMSYMFYMNRSWWLSKQMTSLRIIKRESQNCNERSTSSSCNRWRKIQKTIILTSHSDFDQIWFR